jgi:acetyl-CoA synthetase
MLAWPGEGRKKAMLIPAKDYDALRARFRWDIPPDYNIATFCCDRHAGDPDKLALIYEDEVGAVSRFTFRHFLERANRCANVLADLGIGRGDRIGVLLSQGPDLPVAHLGIYKLGGIALPLFTLFGPDGLQYRLENSEAKAVVTDVANLPKLLEIRTKLPALKTILVTDGSAEDAADFNALLDRASDRFDALATGPEDPALIMYTSGTTGPPKGTLHAHRVVLGHLPGVEMPHEFFPQPGDLFWTPADWAWAGGLLDVLWPSWHHGIPVLAHRARRFDPEAAFALMARHGVRNAFLPPTALKLMRGVSDPARFGARPRSIGSGGEPLGAELLDWGREAFGVTINEFYGQTEANLVLSNCAAIMAPRPGSMGRPVPGHEVAVMDEMGNILPHGETGIVAVKRPDPVMFLEYWRNPEATEKKFVGDWCLTGDLARIDEDGFFWFMGREDDVITSGAYRIGPTEIEDCLLKHPAVALAAAISVPDPQRTEIVKAVLVLKDGVVPNDALAEEIRGFVKTRLAAHEYPREIEFAESLPLTATGKIMRRVLRQQEIEKIRGTSS